MHSGDSRVFLWGQSNVSTPVHIFSGHSEAVLDLQWVNSERLATWSKDRTLRLWGIGKQLKSSLGGDAVDLTASQEESFSTEPAVDLSLEDSGADTISQSGLGVSVKQDPSMSLPILKPSVAGGAGGFAASESGLGSSPSTRSLTSLSSYQQQQDSQTSSISPVFQSVGNQSLAQEFAQLRQENIPNVEIERVSSVCKHDTFSKEPSNEFSHNCAEFEALTDSHLFSMQVALVGHSACKGIDSKTLCLLSACCV